VGTPFLYAFSTQLVDLLLEREQLVILPGSQSRVAAFLANYLKKHGGGRSLLSTVEQAFFQCGEVEELYADVDTLKGLVEVLKYGR